MKLTGEFWKSSGGYIYCVKASGRWHYVGDGQDGVDRMRLVFEEMNRQGVQPHRIGSFCALERLITQHGNCLAAIKRLPHLNLS